MAVPYYCPRCGRAALESLDDKRYGCVSCGYIYFHNTAAAVAAVITCGSTIALITRANDPGLGLLDLPGGFVEGDESLEAATIREVHEEIGVELRDPQYLFSIPNRYEFHGIRYRTVDAFFAFEVTDLPPFTPNDEAAALHWIRMNDIDPARIAFDPVRAALRCLAEARSKQA